MFAVILLASSCFVFGQVIGTWQFFNTFCSLFEPDKLKCNFLNFPFSFISFFSLFFFLIPECNIEFQLDFEYDLKDSSGKNLFSSSENVHLEHSAARFIGNSYISVWRFQEAEFGDKISIRLNFKQDGFQSEVQQLVGNCVIGSKPSVSISIDKQREMVIYSIMTYTDFKIIEAPYNVSLYSDCILFKSLY